MVGCFPSTPKKLGMTIACFLSGAATLVYGVHLSYVNIAPQQARTKARDGLVLETLRKKYGYIPPSQKARNEAHVPPQQARNMARNDLVKETFSNFGFKK